MKIIIFLAVLLTLAACLPWRDQIALVNSLQVGRDEDPMVWGCTGCDQDNKPLSSYVIEEPAQDVKAILSVYDEYTVLAFRYTATLKNVWQDILWAFQRKDQHSCEKCKVQKAMDDMWNSIRDYSLDDLERASHTGRLIITGISLGGALTCLSYIDIAHAQIFDNIQLVTFGAPRVGNKHWAAWFDQQTPSTRYYIKNDPIAALPICLTPICTYRQTGTPVRCNMKSESCQALLSEEPYELDVSEALESVSSGLWEHLSHGEEEEEDVEGIIDHLVGYKKLRDFTLIE